MAAEEGLFSRVWTVPNLISLVRLACAPVVWWLLFVVDEPWPAAILLGVLGASDWVDGWIARKWDQGSELGKVLDPTADRILLPDSVHITLSCISALASLTSRALSDRLTHT